MTVVIECRCGVLLQISVSEYVQGRRGQVRGKICLNNRIYRITVSGANCVCARSVDTRIHANLNPRANYYTVNTPPTRRIKTYAVGSKGFLPDQVFKVTEIKQLCYFST